MVKNNVCNNLVKVITVKIKCVIFYCTLDLLFFNYN